MRPTGSTKNRPIAKESAKTIVPPTRRGDRLLVLGELRVRRDAERLEADLQRLAERDDAADDRQPQMRWRFAPGTSGNDWISIGPSAACSGRGPSSRSLGQRLADRDGPRGDAAHHHALEDGLTPDGRIALRHQRAVWQAGLSA